MNSSNPGIPDPTDPDTAASEDLVARLKAANPVSPAGLGDLSEQADTLFDQIASRSGQFAPYQPPESRPSSRRWSVLVAAAAAVALLAGAVLVFAPTSSQPALAAVQAAAQETAVVRSGRVVTDFRLEGQEAAVENQLEGTLTAAFNGDDFAVTIDLDPTSTDVMTADELAQVSRAETRLIDNNLFITPDGDRWTVMEAPEFVRSALVRFTDLRSILTQVEELVEVDEVGPANVDGVNVTHYRSEVDLADESLAKSGWLPGLEGTEAAPVDIEAEGLVNIDMYVDEDGRMRRVEVSGDAKPADDSVDASATFTVTTNFVDLGADIAIDEPDPAKVQAFSFELDD
jgi:hypothetical protein